MLTELIQRLGSQGISLRQIARTLGYDHAYLSRVVNGKKPLTVRLAAQLANQYRLTTAERLRLFQEVRSFHGANPATMSDVLAKTKVPR